MENTLTLDQAKKAIKEKTCIDFHFKDNYDGQWRWMIILCLSDDETGIYYKRNGTGLTSVFSPLNNIIVDKFG
jgi:hypothetical protein